MWRSSVLTLCALSMSCIAPEPPIRVEPPPVPPDEPRVEPETEICVRHEVTSDARTGLAIRIRERVFDEWKDEVITRLDGDADGIFDRVDERTFDDRAQLVERRTDLDGDGDLDEIEDSFFEDGALVERWIDTDLDGFPDKDHEVFAYNDGGFPTMHVIDRDGDFNLDFVETRSYLQGFDHLLTSVERDDNGDGELEFRSSAAYDGELLVRYEENVGDDNFLEFTIDVIREETRTIEERRTFEAGALVAGRQLEFDVPSSGEPKVVREEDLLSGRVILLVEDGPLHFSWRVENPGGALGSRTRELTEDNQLVSQFDDDDGDGQPERTYSANFSEDAALTGYTAMRVLEDGTVRTESGAKEANVFVHTIAIHDPDGTLISREVYEYIDDEAEPRSVLVEDASGPITRVRYSDCAE